MRYILLSGKEGTKWSDVIPLVVNQDELKTKSVFSEREKPWIIWWLIDADKLPEGVNDMQDIKNMFLDLSKQYGDKFVESNYNVSPFVGFFDMIATTRNWGLLKDWV